MDLLHTGWQTLGGGPPVPGAFHIETVTDPFSHEPVIGMVRHTGTAFVAQVQQPAQADDATWQALAMHYLRALSSALQLSAGQRGWLSPAVWRRLEDTGRGRCRSDRVRARKFPGDPAHSSQASVCGL